jgi:hypothetical protein
MKSSSETSPSTQGRYRGRRGRPTNRQTRAAFADDESDPFDDFDRALRRYRLWEEWERTKLPAETAYRRFHIDVPEPFFELLDAECNQRGVPKQSFVKCVLWEWFNNRVERTKAMDTILGLVSDFLVADKTENPPRWSLAEVKAEGRKELLAQMGELRNAFYYWSKIKEDEERQEPVSIMDSPERRRGEDK